MEIQNISHKMNEVSGANLQDIYSFLSLSMKYPEPSWFTEGYTSNFMIILKEAGFSEEADGLARIAEPDEKVLEDLQVEYTRLFINAVPQVPAPPFGSVYLEAGRSLYGKTTEMVRDFYREHGFDLTDPSAVPDEISLELEFLGRLAGQGRYEEEERFLSDFFRPWFIRFRDIVVAEAGHPFYVALVRLIDFFTLQEED